MHLWLVLCNWTQDNIINQKIFYCNMDYVKQIEFNICRRVENKFFRLAAGNPIAWHAPSTQVPLRRLRQLFIGPDLS